MKLSQLVYKLNVSGNFDPDTEVVDIVSDSRAVKEGSLFVCIKGARFDGHSVAEECLKRGASAVVVEHSLGLEQEVIVEDSRAALAIMCSNYFGRPQDQLKLIAVTGTNGKTTIANVIKQSLEACGKKAGVIGTIGIEAGDIVLPAKFTTPEPWDMEMILRTLANSGCEYVVMEASSQALDQRRLVDLHYDTAVFTNLSQDHLDYHKTMDAYFEAKCMLFKQCDYAVINLDDPRGRELYELAECPKVGYAIDSSEAEYRADNLVQTIGESSFTVIKGKEKAYCTVPLPGRFSVYNALACIATVDRQVMDVEQAAKGVSATRGVSGRCEILHKGKETVISDYAHTDDALTKLLSSIKPYVGDGRLVVLFGCAGRRDKTKRVKMANAIADYSDVAVLSSDNPRDENPFEIMQELIPIFSERHIPFIMIPDRYYAIEHVLKTLREGDVFVLCCKGHEDYQVIDNYTVYLDERRIVREYYAEEK
ncbi:MAG: UDP-N-acetylmuramoyl-L-alanyl-D-glutamate--2,6-diaminopimelate ligase [Oscillospiraceae bacterium]|nr:UDP-N-acetylmuramoyl-L-alanyl-D-glutamate--2,6-diaminopimelate ligase [Oscillospiraceae bacterium]